MVSEVEVDATARDVHGIVGGTCHRADVRGQRSLRRAPASGLPAIDNCPSLQTGFGYSITSHSLPHQRRKVGRATDTPTAKFCSVITAATLICGAWSRRAQSHYRRPAIKGRKSPAAARWQEPCSTGWFSARSKDLQVHCRRHNRPPSRCRRSPGT